MSYKAPLNDMLFVMNELAGLSAINQLPGCEDATADTVEAVLEENAKFCANVVAPLNHPSDQQPSFWHDGEVTTAKGFKDAFKGFAEAGWQGVQHPSEFGGQGLPKLVATPCIEMLNASSISFALVALLSDGAIEALLTAGSDQQKATYLEPLITGKWTGTMNLTEPDAGSDLAAIKSRAIPQGDHYLISGQKIFITWGDHQMTDNVVHLVLARLPDAPAGVKGISLFVVPKFLLDAQGEPGARNDARCISLEHKLGIHGSPTCVMSFGDNGGAIGYLVGEPHQGLACMFTMMNHARQSVGLQGLAISERAYQQARQYAKDRLQGTRKDGSRFSIIHFPDVRRMLLQMKSSIEAMRALALVAAAEVDRTAHAPDADAAQVHQGRVDLLTPIVKGWLTEMAQEVTSLGVQIHGGMGFIEETGAAQHYRDARILTIYEGTTGIQALDLVGRKTLLNQGELLTRLLDEIGETVALLQGSTTLAPQAEALGDALAAGRAALRVLLDNAKNDAHLAGSVSVNFMMLFGYLCGGWLMARSALSAQALLDSGNGDPQFLDAKRITANFYAEQLLPRVHALLAAIGSGSKSIMALDDEQF